ncbi:MAG: sulfatase family protein [Thermomicrobiales bacterium]
MPLKWTRRSVVTRMGALAVPVLMPSAAGVGAAQLAVDPSARGEKRPEKSKRGDGQVTDKVFLNRPNVIVIVTDDMRASDWVALPETQRLIGDRGTVFPNFILNTPVCGPSRATLFTGKLPRNHGVLENNEADGDAWTSMMAGPGKRGTIYNEAQKAGYRTGLVGKFLNGAPPSGRIAPGFDRWYSTSELDYYDFELNENGITQKYAGNAYSTDVLADHAVAFIEETPAEQPFLLFFTPKAPKGPATPSAKYVTAFPDAQARRTPAWNETDITDKPESVRRRDPLSRQDVSEMDDKERRRLQTLLSVDDAIGLIWRSLRRTNREDNTIIMVMSDNGYAIGEHLLDGKGRPYDEMVRVPMMAFGPGFEAGGVDERMVSMADIAPTLKHAMSVGLQDVDGASLLDDWTREYVPIETPGGKQAYWALRGRDELYVEYDDGEREYYDYLADPYELDNQLADWDGQSPTLDPVRAEDLAARLQEFRVCSGKSCRGTVALASPA